MMKFALISAAILSGCVNTGVHVTDPEQAASPGKTSFLCVGMESSARFGSCPGCALDAKRLTSLMKTRLGYSGDLIISEEATKASVVDKLRKGISKTPEDGLFLFFYSGHGGQENLGGTEPDGADRPDEYLCLYDTYMQDDEIWEIVSACRGRVFLYFDACHSATMYRSVASDKAVAAARAKGTAEARALDAGNLVSSKGFTFHAERFVKAKALELSSGQSPRILCWSGCKEAEYSYGGNAGGALTIAVVNNWRDGISYKDLFTSASRDVNRSQPTQHPVQTAVGAFSNDAEAFK